MTAPRWLDRRIAAAGPHLTLCLTEDDLRAAVRHLGAPAHLDWPARGARCYTLTTPDGRLTCVVCMTTWQGRDPIEVAGMLVHEAVHVWQQYADDIGETEPGREQEAYAVQSIAQELMADFARRITQARPASAPGTDPDVQH